MSQTFPKMQQLNNNKGMCNRIFKISFPPKCVIDNLTRIGARKYLTRVALRSCTLFHLLVTLCLAPRMRICFRVERSQRYWCLLGLTSCRYAFYYYYFYYYFYYSRIFIQDNQIKIV